jgi:exodeoxyribonuclease VII small subunit
MERAMEEKDDLTYEQALEELEGILSKLEGEGLTLDETVALYERGRTLAQHCQQLLDTVELRIQQVREDEHGESHVEPFLTERGT